jgi:hypothetical protein
MGRRRGGGGDRWARGRARTRAARLSGTLGLVAAGALALAACSSSTPAAASTTRPTTSTTAGTGAPVWLCRPGLAHDPCAGDLTATVVRADGSTSVQHARPAAHPSVNCFYVYPTVSTQPTGNATLAVQPAETAVAVAQAERFSTVCHVWAPMYRQLTVASLLGKSTTAPSIALAYGDVLAAWKYFLAHEDHGHGVVLIGHSQGASMLIRLLRAEVDPNPAERRLLVSAILLGGNVEVPLGKLVGGDFSHIPACTSTTETGCVVAYSSFDQTPPSDSLFGRAGAGVSALSGTVSKTSPMQVLCVNPASLAHPDRFAVLDPYFPTGTGSGVFSSASVAAHVPTPWVTYPDLYRARCEYQDGTSWLQVDTTGLPGDTRPVVTETLGPTWGLHLVDVNIALGDLVTLVGDQAHAYVTRR